VPELTRVGGTFVSQRRKTIASAGFPAEAFDPSSVFAFSTLSSLSRGECPPEFSQLGRVADLRDEPGLPSDTRCHLLLHGVSDWRRPEGDRVTSLGDSDVVLSSVLAEEQSLFTIQQAC